MSPAAVINRIEGWGDFMAVAGVAGALACVILGANALWTITSWLFFATALSAVIGGFFWRAVCLALGAILRGQMVRSS